MSASSSCHWRLTFGKGVFPRTSLQEVRSGKPSKMAWSSNLVAAFDASGFSAAVEKWKASLRICFLEIAVSPATAARARALVIQLLEDSWPINESWAVR